MPTAPATQSRKAALSSAYAEPPPNWRALGTTSHAADQLVSGNAEARAKLRCTLKLNRIGQRTISLVGRLEMSRPAK
jgi:hypothetical protein